MERRTSFLHLSQLLILISAQPRLKIIAYKIRTKCLCDLRSSLFLTLKSVSLLIVMLLKRPRELPLSCLNARMCRRRKLTGFREWGAVAFIQIVTVKRIKAEKSGRKRDRMREKGKALFWCVINSTYRVSLTSIHIFIFLYLHEIVKAP